MGAAGKVYRPRFSKWCIFGVSQLLPNLPIVTDATHCKNCSDLLLSYWHTTLKCIMTSLYGRSREGSGAFE